MNIYQEQILEHYHHPHNAGKPAQYTHTAKLQNLSCGDEITVYLTIENGVVTAAQFEAEGCAISIASASLLSDELRGKTVEEVKQLTYEGLEKLLGIELTPSRSKCASLALEAFQEALEK